METRYRCATADDATGIFVLLMLMHEEVGMFEIDQVKVMSRVLQVLESGLVFVADVGGLIVASIGIETRAMWYSRDVYLGETWMFVAPEFRKSRHFLKLIRMVQAYREKAGVPLVLGVFSPDGMDRKTAFFRRLFPRVVGEVYVEGL